MYCTFLAWLPWKCTNLLKTLSCLLQISNEINSTFMWNYYNYCKPNLCSSIYQWKLCIDEQMIQSPDKIYFANNYLQIVQLTANSHHKLFTVARTDADVLTRRMSPFTVKTISQTIISQFVQQRYHKKIKKNFTVSTMQSVSVKQIM